MAQKHLWKSYGTNGAYKTVKDLSFIAVYVCFSLFRQKYIFGTKRTNLSQKYVHIGMIFFSIELLLRIIIMFTRK